MHVFWTIPTSNMTYTRVQTYTNMVVGEFGIQIFEVVVVVLLLLILSYDLFVPTSAHPLLFLDKWLSEYIEMPVVTITRWLVNPN